jgi:hypothetical protein
MANKRKNGKREPNGRLSRKPVDRQVRDKAEVAAAEWDTMGVGLMARYRVHGVDPKSLKDQMAGSAVGRFCLKGQITHQQYDAAMAYLEEREEYLRCIQVPRQPGAVDLNATKGQSVSRENVARIQQIVAARKVSENALREKQFEVGNRGNIFGAIEAVLLRDVELDHLLGDLRSGLNALVRRYRMVEEKAA